MSKRREYPRYPGEDINEDGAGPAPSSRQAQAQDLPDLKVMLDEIKTRLKGEGLFARTETIEYVYEEKLKFFIADKTKGSIDRLIMSGQLKEPLLLRDDVVTFFHKVSQYFPERGGDFSVCFERIIFLLPNMTAKLQEDVNNCAVQYIKLLTDAPRFKEGLQFFVNNFDGINERKYLSSRKTMGENVQKIYVLYGFFMKAAKIDPTMKDEALLIRFFNRLKNSVLADRSLISQFEDSEKRRKFLVRIEQMLKEDEVGVNASLGLPKDPVLATVWNKGGNEERDEYEVVRNNTSLPAVPPKEFREFYVVTPEEVQGVVSPSNAWQVDVPLSQWGQYSFSGRSVGAKNKKMPEGRSVGAKNKKMPEGGVVEAAQNTYLMLEDPSSGTSSKKSRKDRWVGGAASSSQAQADIDPKLKEMLEKVNGVLGPEVSNEDKLRMICSIYGDRDNMGFAITDNVRDQINRSIASKKIFLIEPEVVTFFYKKLKLFPDRNSNNECFERIMYLLKSTHRIRVRTFIEGMGITKLSEAADFDELLKFYVQKFADLKIDIRQSEQSASYRVLMFYCFFNVAKAIGKDGEKLNLEDKETAKAVLGFFNEIQQALNGGGWDVFNGGFSQRTDVIKDAFLLEMIRKYKKQSSPLDLDAALKELKELKEKEDEVLEWPSKEVLLFVAAKYIYMKIMKFNDAHPYRFARGLFYDERVAKVFFEIKKSLNIEEEKEEEEEEEEKEKEEKEEKKGLFEKILFLFVGHSTDLKGRLLEFSILNVEGFSKKKEVVKIFVCNFDKIKEALYNHDSGAAQNIVRTYSFFMLAENIFNRELRQSHATSLDLTRSVNQKVLEYIPFFSGVWDSASKGDLHLLRFGEKVAYKEFAESIQSISLKIVEKVEDEVKKFKDEMSASEKEAVDLLLGLRGIPAEKGPEQPPSPAIEGGRDVAGDPLPSEADRIEEGPDFSAPIPPNTSPKTAGGPASQLRSLSQGKQR